MKIYLAGRYVTKDKLALLANKLEEYEHEITARWLKVPQGEAQEAALEDLEDVKEADALVSFTENETIGYNTGGRHVEFGAAWAWNKKLIIVGPKENIFHDLPGVVHLESFDDLLDYLPKVSL